MDAEDTDPNREEKLRAAKEKVGHTHTHILAHLCTLNDKSEMCKFVHTTYHISSYNVFTLKYDIFLLVEKVQGEEERGGHSPCHRDVSSCANVCVRATYSSTSPSRGDRVP